VVSLIYRFAHSALSKISKSSKECGEHELVTDPISAIKIYHGRIAALLYLLDYFFIVYVPSYNRI